MFFFLMIRRPPRSTLDRSSAASDVYKRQGNNIHDNWDNGIGLLGLNGNTGSNAITNNTLTNNGRFGIELKSVSYTHLRAHETVLDLVCRLLLEKKQNKTTKQKKKNNK
mgnify:CR=1 FL=1